MDGRQHPVADGGNAGSEGAQGQAPAQEQGGVPGDSGHPQCGGRAGGLETGNVYAIFFSNISIYLYTYYKTLITLIVCLVVCMFVCLRPCIRILDTEWLL